jgi:hypothetical protein
MVERLDIDTLLLFVDQRNGFMESFEHVLGRYRKSAPSKPAIIASLMAYATNIGLGRMADIRNLSYQEISTAAGNYNATDILPAVHSTDTHGANQVNFALLHLFGYRFAPRYRNVRGKVETGLYGFHPPRHYEKDWPIKPIRRVREGLIVSEWPNIERILLSLALKTTTQSVIVGKLSAYRRKNRTKRALWELDNIVRSLYLLDYIDSPVLRHNVQRALNRGEAYHQLRRAIAYAHGGRFRARSQHEQEVWNECARLVGNAVVYYNALILSEALAELERRSELVSSEVIKRVSPVAWQHINFYGRYQFDADFTPIDFARLREQLSSEEVSRLYANAGH